MKKMEEKDATEVKLDNTKEIELPQLDVDKYIGKDVAIEKVTEHKGDFGYYIKVATKPLETLPNGLEIKASRVFGLQEDSEGNIGWGKNTNLGAFLAKHSKKHYKDLVGMKVKVQTVTNKKDGKDYLSFN